MASIWVRIGRGMRLKSFLQKSIRRGMDKEALTVLDQAWDEGFYSEIFRRLPVIVAEDIGFEKVADSVYLGHICRATGEDRSLPLVKAFVKDLCTDKTKSRTVGYLQGVAWDMIINEKEKEPADTDRLGRLLASSNEVAGSVQAIKCLESKGKPRRNLWKAMEKEALLRGIDPVRTVNAVKNRIAKGCRMTDRQMLVTAGVMSICRTFREDFYGVNGKLDWPWFVLDMHTGPGKRAMIKVCEKHGLAENVVEQLWYWFVSAKETKAHGVKYRAEFFDRRFRSIGFRDRRDARAVWKKIAHDIESQVKEEMKRHG